MLTIRKEQLLALETAMRREWAHAAVAELSETHPYVLAGLHPAEIRARLEIAAGKSNGYGFDLPETVRAYVRLSFLIGPHFDVHPSFRSVLTSNNSGLARMFRLLSCVPPEAWTEAEATDIVSRYSDPAPEGQTWPMLKQPLSLVPLDRHHSEAYFHLSSHPDVWRGRRTAPLPTVEMTSHLIREWSATPQRTDYTIEDDSGLFCGALSLKENQSCQHLAYWVGRTFWGQGVATQAVRRLITTLSARHTGGRICVSIAKGNLPSIRVAGKNGFVQASSMIEPAREGPGDALSFTLSY